MKKIFIINLFFVVGFVSNAFSVADDYVALQGAEYELSQYRMNFVKDYQAGYFGKDFNKKDLNDVYFYSNEVQENPDIFIRSIRISMAQIDGFLKTLTLEQKAIYDQARLNAGLGIMLAHRFDVMNAQEMRDYAHQLLSQFMSGVSEKAVTNFKWNVSRDIHAYNNKHFNDWDLRNNLHNAITQILVHEDMPIATKQRAVTYFSSVDQQELGSKLGNMNGEQKTRYDQILLTRNQNNRSVEPSIMLPIAKRILNSDNNREFKLLLPIDAEIDARITQQFLSSALAEAARFSSARQADVPLDNTYENEYATLSLQARFNLQDNRILQALFGSENLNDLIRRNGRAVANTKVHLSTSDQYHITLGTAESTKNRSISIVDRSYFKKFTREFLNLNEKNYVGYIKTMGIIMHGLDAENKDINEFYNSLEDLSNALRDGKSAFTNQANENGSKITHFQIVGCFAEDGRLQADALHFKERYKATGMLRDVYENALKAPLHVTVASFKAGFQGSNRKRYNNPFSIDFVKKMYDHFQDKFVTAKDAGHDNLFKENGITIFKITHQGEATKPRREFKDLFVLEKGKDFVSYYYKNGRRIAYKTAGNIR